MIELVKPILNTNWLVFSLLSLMGEHVAAYENEGEFGYQSHIEAEAELYTPESAHFHFPYDHNRVLKFDQLSAELKIPPEADSNLFQTLPIADQLNTTAVNQQLKWIDPEGGIGRYLTFDANSLSLLNVFFTRFFAEKENLDSSPLLTRLQQISQQPDQSLLGLKVLIDPGHMGSAEWDENTGKYVQVAAGKVSEGEINLHTALLLAQQLEKLGASVRLTRQTLAPASKIPLSQYDPTSDIHEYFYSSLDDWIDPHFDLELPELVQAVRRSPQFSRMNSANRKTEFFIRGEDLKARTDLIAEFEPDITLDIHFDASDRNAVQNRVNALEAYVPGSFLKTETGSKATRAYALKHLLEVRRWSESVRLAKAITQKMSQHLKVPLLKTMHYPGAVKVHDGVYARNLAITKRAIHGLVVYLECLKYDHVTEHRVLLNKNKTGQYKQQTFLYSSRLDTVVSGIMAGILDYFYEK
jgi:N-acetylmuramoyl-L-alanine amidase